MNEGRGPIERARFRRQPAPVRFAFAERIDYLNGEHWDRVTARGGPLQQRAYHRELEAVRPPNLDPRYALIYDEHEPVAALAMQIVTVDGARVLDSDDKPGGGLRGLAARGARELGRRQTVRALVVGNLLTYGCHGIAFAPGRESDSNVWHGIGEAAYRVRRAEKHTGHAGLVLVKDLTAAQIEASSLLHDLGYRAVETEPDMVLAVDPAWRSYDDYLAALTSKYRKNVRNRVLKPSDAAGLTVAVADHDEVAALAPRLQELYLAVHGNATLRPVTLGVDYWPALARGAGADARFLVLRRDLEVLGFVVALRDANDTVIAYHIGFDRTAAAELPLYLRLLHAAIADAIANGARRVSFGRTALEPKAMLGARPEPLHLWVRHRHPLLNKLLRGLLSHIHHDDAPVRNPFPADDSA